jgi:hypothetical protein
MNAHPPPQSPSGATSPPQPLTRGYARVPFVAGACPASAAFDGPAGPGRRPKNGALLYNDAAPNGAGNLSRPPPSSRPLASRNAGQIRGCSPFAAGPPGLAPRTPNQSTTRAPHISLFVFFAFLCGWVHLRHSASICVNLRTPRPAFPLCVLCVPLWPLPPATPGFASIRVDSRFQPSPPAPHISRFALGAAWRSLQALWRVLLVTGSGSDVSWNHDRT